MTATSKLLLQRTSFAVRRISASPRCPAHFLQISPAVSMRNFSAEPEKVVCYDDLVKETLKKMIAERGTEHPLKPIADDDLERRFDNYDGLVREAESCISDLKEATPAEREEEFACAKGAVDTAFEAYVDLLDDLRKANEEQIKAYKTVREENAKRFIHLKRALAEIKNHNS